jgi:hypothetical protein
MELCKFRDGLFFVQVRNRDLWKVVLYKQLFPYLKGLDKGQLLTHFFLSYIIKCKKYGIFGSLKQYIYLLINTLLEIELKWEKLSWIQRESARPWPSKVTSSLTTMMHSRGGWIRGDRRGIFLSSYTDYLCI